MPDPAASEALAAAVCEVLETMFFTCVYAETPGPEAAERIEARVSFSGERRGEFCLGISLGAARSIAAGFLGVDDESQVGAAQIGDVICEVTNMVCGSLLSHLGADLAFDLDPPRLAGPAKAAEPECLVRTFDLGVGALTAGVHFEPL